MSSPAPRTRSRAYDRSPLLRYEIRTVISLDLLAATIATATGWAVRFGESVPAHPVAALLTCLFPVGWVGAMAAGGAYDRRHLTAGPDLFRRALNAGVWLAAVIGLSSFLFHADLSRGFLGITLPSAFLLTFCGRYAVRKRLHRHLADGHVLHRVVVVGGPASCESIAKHMQRSSYAGYRVVGTHGQLPRIQADDPNLLHQHTQTVLAGLLEEVRAQRADTIAVAGGDALGNVTVQRLSWELEGSGVKLMVAPDVADVAGPRMVVHPLSGLPLLHIDEPVFTGPRRLLKECIDRVGAAVLLIVAGPVLALISVASLLSQGRPIIYRQQRVGRDGREFTIHKFRTMHNGADRQLNQLAHLNQHSGELFKIKTDPRVTPLGRVLRKYSLDELPQLWDVLTGSMSLVGPRPPLPAEVARYGEDARRRLLVKPGITGLWQVSGRSDLPWDETVRLDLHYVENWSVGLDISLLCRTLLAVVRPQGAY